jgi:hypothetical protein
MHLDRDFFERGARLFNAGYLIFLEGIPFIEGMIFLVRFEEAAIPRVRKEVLKRVGIFDLDFIGNFKNS